MNRTPCRLFDMPLVLAVGGEPMKFTTSSLLVSIVGLTTLLSAAGPSLALPVFDVDVETGGPTGTFFAHQEVTGDSFVSTLTNNSGAIPFGNGSVSAVALAGPGLLGARTSSSLSVEDVSNFSEALSSTATARFILDDLVITGPESTVPLALRLDVSGTTALNTSNSSLVTDLNTSFAASVAKAESEVRLTGFFSFLDQVRLPEEVDFGGTLHRDVSSFGCVGCVFIQESSSGIFDGFTSAATLLTPIFDAAPVAVPFSLDVELSVRSFVLYGAPFFVNPGMMSASSATNFANTVSFPTVGPVFNLPAGYTVDSVNGMIVNNRWTGGGEASVPEPSSLFLLCSGLVGLVLWRWKQAV